MSKENLSKLLISYGEFITDEEFQAVNVSRKARLDDVRIRIIRYGFDGRLFYHKMVNGYLVDCFEIR